MYSLALVSLLLLILSTVRFEIDCIPIKHGYDASDVHLLPNYSPIKKHELDRRTQRTDTEALLVGSDGAVVKSNENDDSVDAERKTQIEDDITQIPTPIDTHRFDVQSPNVNDQISSYKHRKISSSKTKDTATTLFVTQHDDKLDCGECNLSTLWFDDQNNVKHQAIVNAFEDAETKCKIFSAGCRHGELYNIVDENDLIRHFWYREPVIIVCGPMSKWNWRHHSGAVINITGFFCTANDTINDQRSLLSNHVKRSDDNRPIQFNKQAKTTESPNSFDLKDEANADDEHDDNTSDELKNIDNVYVNGSDANIPTNVAVIAHDIPSSVAETNPSLIIDRINISSINRAAIVVDDSQMRSPQFYIKNSNFEQTGLNFSELTPSSGEAATEKLTDWHGTTTVSSSDRRRKYRAKTAAVAQPNEHFPSSLNELIIKSQNTTDFRNDRSLDTTTSSSKHQRTQLDNHEYDIDSIRNLQLSKEDATSSNENHRFDNLFGLLVAENREEGTHNQSSIHEISTKIKQPTSGAAKAAKDFAFRSVEKVGRINRTAVAKSRYRSQPPFEETVKTTSANLMKNESKDNQKKSAIVSADEKIPSLEKLLSTLSTSLSSTNISLNDFVYSAISALADKLNASNQPELLPIEPAKNLELLTKKSTTSTKTTIVPRTSTVKIKNKPIATTNNTATTAKYPSSAKTTIIRNVTLPTIGTTTTKLNVVQTLNLAIKRKIDDSDEWPSTINDENQDQNSTNADATTTDSTKLSTSNTDGRDYSFESREGDELWNW